MWLFVSFKLAVIVGDLIITLIAQLFKADIL